MATNSLEVLETISVVWLRSKRIDSGWIRSAVWPWLKNLKIIFKFDKVRFVRFWSYGYTKRSKRIALVGTPKPQERLKWRLVCRENPNRTSNFLVRLAGKDVCFAVHRNRADWNYILDEAHRIMDGVIAPNMGARIETSVVAYIQVSWHQTTKNR